MKRQTNSPALRAQPNLRTASGPRAAPPGDSPDGQNQADVVAIVRPRRPREPKIRMRENADLSSRFKLIWVVQSCSAK